MKRAEAQGVKAFVWTIDAPATSTRHRAARYDTTNAYVDSIIYLFASCTN